MRLHASSHLVLLLPALFLGCTCGDQDGLEDARPELVVISGGQSGVEAVEGNTRFAMDLGLVAIGEEATGAMELRNEGRAELTLRDLRVEGPDASAFQAAPSARAIATGASARIVLTFTPVAEAPAHATLVFGTDDPAAPLIEVSLAGTGYLPAVDVSPQALDFGPVVVGTTRTLSVQVTNRSPKELAVSVRPVQPEAMASFFEVDWSGRGADRRLSLGPEQAMELKVTYGPTAAGRHAAGLALEPCPSCRIVTIGLAGSTLDTALLVEPSFVEFGAVNPGRSVTKAVRFQAVGNVPVTVDELSLASLAAGPADPAFDLVALALPLTVSPGETAEVEISFSPPDLDDRVAMIEWSSDDPHNPGGTIPLHGTGGGPGITLVPRPVSFGEVAVGTTRTRRVVIENPGYADTVITGIGLESSPAFSLDSVPQLPVVIAPGEHLVVAVALSPRVEGAAEGALVVSSNVGHEPEAVATLVGAGRELGPCRHRVAPGALDFGNVEPETAITLPLLLENTGSEPCLIGGPELTPDSDPAFSIEEGTTESLLLGPGERHRVAIRFLPTRSGQFGGAAAYYVSTAESSERAVPLLGRSLQAALRVAPAVLDFGDLGSACPVREKRFCVLNEGSVTEKLTGVEVVDAAADSAFHLFDLPEALNGAGVTVDPGGRACFLVRFEPPRARRYLDVLHVEVEGKPHPLVLPLVGSVSDGGSLPGHGCLLGRICSPSGDRWLAGAEVYTLVSDPPGQSGVLATSTDEAGFFTLANVPVGHRHFHVEKGSFATDFYADILEGEATVVPEPQCVRGDSASIAVLRGTRDSIELVLARLGLTDVDLHDDPAALLVDYQALSSYEALFINCGAEVLAADSPLVQQNLRTFVAEGGSLYVSDYAYAFVITAWPGIVKIINGVNDDQSLRATVVDPRLALYLGKTVADLNLHRPALILRAFPPASALIVTDLPSEGREDMPVVISFDYYDGSVIYTSMHNAAQTTADMDAILEYLVFEL